ncbi:slit homolog 2 protein-like [Saccostrea cucullata]|uniref:slit homolog 2 protein-like n=1 Tax=Saccostrea cuccullata TaxID=36930 RepID=UPI002ED5976C
MSALTNLERLYLNQNRMTTIKSSIFTGLTKLTDLDLSGNTITTIEENAFSDLTKLKILALYGNRITTFTNTTISGLISQPVLTLHDNPYHCDCKLIGMLDYIKTGFVSVPERIRCFTPEKLKGIKLVSLSSANLTCSEMTTIPITTTETEGETTEFIKTTYETNSSPLKVKNFLVMIQISLYLLVNTMI